ANSTHSTWPRTTTFIRGVSHSGAALRFNAMMDAVTVPPFERFYEAWSGEILAFLRRRLGAAEAEDAFQETFLRALRGYGNLEHGRELRAWAYTIAARVAADGHRPRRPAAEAAEGAA